MYLQFIAHKKFSTFSFFAKDAQKLVWFR